VQELGQDLDQTHELLACVHAVAQVFVGLVESIQALHESDPLGQGNHPVELVLEGGVAAVVEFVLHTHLVERDLSQDDHLHEFGQTGQGVCNQVVDETHVRKGRNAQQHNFLDHKPTQLVEQQFAGQEENQEWHCDFDHVEPLHDGLAEDVEVVTHEHHHGQDEVDSSQARPVGQAVQSHAAEGADFEHLAPLESVFVEHLDGFAHEEHQEDDGGLDDDQLHQVVRVADGDLVGGHLELLVEHQEEHAGRQYQTQHELKEVLVRAHVYLQRLVYRLERPVSTSPKEILLEEVLLLLILYFQQNGLVFNQIRLLVGFGNRVEILLVDHIFLVLHEFFVDLGNSHIVAKRKRVEIYQFFL